MTNNDIKYKAIFGDMAQFNGMMPDCVFISGEYGYKIVEDTLYYCERYNERYGWTKSCAALEGFRPVAMRRIIKEPKHWTVEDQKAGRLPEVGSNAQYINQGIVVEVLAIKNGWIVVVNVDGINREPFILPSSGFIQYYNPIETPAEKAQRLRSEWVKHALDLYMSSPKNDFASMGDVYDALLSGELQAPKWE